MKKIFLVLILLSAVTLSARENRWYINGNHSVQWDTSKGSLPYADHIEMSGLRASVVYYWNGPPPGLPHAPNHPQQHARQLDAALRRGFPEGNDGQWPTDD